VRRLGVDVGGTFTDIIFVDDSGAVRVHKIPTTTQNPAEGTVAGIRQIAGESDKVDYIAHGTTIATNVILTHTGASVGLITTRGFRDILQLARHKKPLNFSFYQDIPWHEFPLVPRKNRLTVEERIVPPDGSVEIPLNEDQVLEALETLKVRGVEAIAICFLFSFLNPEHEERAAALAREAFPDSFISVRSELLRQHREYEVFSTVCLNAYVGPAVANYVRNLEAALAEGNAPSSETGSNRVHYMTSSGGIATSAGVIRRPVALLTSGPVGGLIGGVHAGRTTGFPNVITLDVGGTSADIGVSVGGELRRRHLLESQIGGYAVAMPMIDLDTIGAGGGSIAFVDDGGVFRVGPESAGASPGPACYGRGGDKPTVTDAQIVLGRLREETPLAGVLPLKRSLAEHAIERQVANPLGLNVHDAAVGVLQISTELMVQAVESNSVQRGYDPRDFALVALGGAGPMFAIDIAVRMDIPWVVVPPFPGIGAAIGLLASDVMYEDSRTIMAELDENGWKAASAAYQQMSETMAEQLQTDGFELADTHIDLLADCRYFHQGYELTIGAPHYTTEEWPRLVRRAFDSAHEREYGRSFEDFRVQFVAARIRGSGHMPKLELPQVAPGGELNPKRALVAEKEITHLLPAPHRAVTSVFARDRLLAGDTVSGPAILEQIDTTTIIAPGAVAEVRPDGSLVVDCRNVRGSQ
jgi:N-methylhydantoinase A/oxoprolinase/acetone carboxylase beta subunit